MMFSRDDHPSNRPLLAFVLLALLVGGAATFFTEPSIPTWYAALHKPGFNPPDWVFAPGLDHALCADGGGRFAHLETGRLRRRNSSSGSHNWR